MRSFTQHQSSKQVLPSNNIQIDKFQLQKLITKSENLQSLRIKSSIASFSLRLL